MLDFSMSVFERFLVCFLVRSLVRSLVRKSQYLGALSKKSKCYSSRGTSNMDVGMTSIIEYQHDI